MTRLRHDADYVLSKLKATARGLPTGGAKMVERLRDLFVSHLHVLNDCDFPEPLLDDWKRIYGSLTAEGAVYRGEELVLGALDNTLDRMSEADATEIAGWLVDLKNEYEKWLSHQRATGSP